MERTGSSIRQVMCRTEDLSVACSRRTILDSRYLKCLKEGTGKAPALLPLCSEQSIDLITFESVGETRVGHVACS